MSPGAYAIDVFMARRKGTCVVLALTLLLSAVPASADAEIDVWAAFSLPGIELRDSRNNEISRTELEKGLREGTRRSARRAAGLSRLTGLRVLLAFMDRPDLLASALRAEVPGSGRGGSAFVAVSREPEVRPPAGRVLPAPEPRANLSVSPLQLTTTPGRVRVLNPRE